MKEKNKSNDMASELFIFNEGNAEYWIPPKGKDDYLKDLESEHDTKAKKKYIWALIETFRFEARENGGKYNQQSVDEMVIILKKVGLNPELSEHVAEKLLQEGAYCEKVGDYENAIKFYESSLPYKIQDIKFSYYRINNLAFCYNFMTRFEEAEKLLREAVKAQPYVYNAWKNLGVSLEHQGQFEEAAECYLKAITFSRGEHRSIEHFLRLIERYPSLRNVPDIAEELKLND